MSFRQNTISGPETYQIGPLWAHMGLYGTSWIGLGRLRKLSVRLLDQFRTFRVQKWYFDEIYR